MTETINNANAAASTLFLGHNGEWWDFWLIVSVIIAALAATAVGIMTTGSLVSHKREAIAAGKALAAYQLETGKQISGANAEAAKANARAAGAQADAARAGERASALESDAAKARERTATLEKETAEAKAGIAVANARAAEANEKAEAERLERVKLEIRLAARTIPQQAHDAFVPLLRAAGSFRADVFAYAEGSTPDTAPFGQSLWSILNEAGWTAKYWATIGGAGVVRGIVVITREGSSDEIEHAADVLVNGLRAAEIAASKWGEHFKTNEAKEIPGTAGVTGPNWDANDVAPIRILIGTKPE